MLNLVPLLSAVALSTTSVTWSAANSVATGDQDAPAIAANRNGGVAVVWEDDRDTAAPENDNHSEIYLRYYVNGIPAYEIKLSPGGTSGTDRKHVTPDVGLDDRGNAVVVWAHDPDGNGFFNIPYRVVSPAGAILGSGQANADATGDQIRPKVAVDPDGASGSASAVAFTVVWEDVQTTAVTIRAWVSDHTGVPGVWERSFTAGGTARHSDIEVAAGGSAPAAGIDDNDGNMFDQILLGLGVTNDDGGWSLL